MSSRIIPSAGDYSNDGFWSKVRSFFRKAGTKVIGKALQLYYAAQSPDTPAWARAVIYGALGYFIMPVDALPDVVPVVGFSDDLGVLAAAIATTAAYITNAMRDRADRILRNWFGD